MKNLSEVPTRSPEVLRIPEQPSSDTEAGQEIGSTAIGAQCEAIELVEEPDPTDIANSIFSTYVRTYKIHAKRTGVCSEEAEKNYYKAQTQLQELVNQYDGRTKSLISQATLAHLEQHPGDESYVAYVSRALMDQIESLEVRSQYIDL